MIKSIQSEQAYKSGTRKDSRKNSSDLSSSGSGLSLIKTWSALNDKKRTRLKKIIQSEYMYSFLFILNSGPPFLLLYMYNLCKGTCPGNRFRYVIGLVLKIGSDAIINLYHLLGGAGTLLPCAPMLYSIKNYYTKSTSFFTQFSKK
jgi:hypothetical protein